MKWGKRPEEWRKKFAWLPVCIDGIWIWWEHYDITGWYYDPSKCPDNLIKSMRHPSKL